MAHSVGFSLSQPSKMALEVSSVTAELELLGWLRVTSSTRKGDLVHLARWLHPTDQIRADREKESARSRSIIIFQAQ